MDPTRFGQLTCDVSNINHGTLDNLNLEQTCPLDHGKHRADSSADPSGLGRLNILPLDILSMIFPLLDIQSLFTCRRLSRRAMYIIDSLSEYRDIIHFVPNAIRGALSIESGSYITCRTLHKSIFDSKCVGEVLDYLGGTDEERCDNPAQFVCVLTGRRWCLSHMSVLRREDRHLPLLLDEAEHIFGLPAQEMSDIPSFRSLPGQYSPGLHPCDDRLFFLDGPSIRARAASFYRSDEALLAFQRRRLLDGVLSNRVLFPMKHEFLSPTPDYMVENTVRESDPLPLSWNLGRLRIRRFMTVVRSPQLDYRERLPRWGRYCVACQEWDFRCWLTVTVETLERHLMDHERNPVYFKKKVPLEFSDTDTNEMQLNSKWPHVERRLVCKSGKSGPRWKELWAHDDILARWNGRRFR